MEGGDLVVEAGAVEEAPADARIFRAGEFCQGCRDFGEGLAEGRFDHSLFFLRERVAVRGADGLVDRRLSVGLARGPAELAQVGVVDVAGEDDDGARLFAALPGGDFSEK